MAHNHTHHHHHHGSAHPPAPVLPSLLRASLARRLAIAAGLSVLVWLAVFGAIGR